MKRMKAVKNQSRAIFAGIILLVCFSLKLASIILCFDWGNSSRLLLKEAFLITVCSLAISRPIKCLVLPIPIFLHVAQFVNACSTGNFIEVLTLQNLGEAGTLGTKELLRLSVLGLGYLILFVPDIFLRLQIVWKNKILAVSASFLCVLAIAIAELAYPKFPIHHFVHQASVAYRGIGFEPTGKNGELFFKNAVPGASSELVRKYRDAFGRPLNVIVIFTEGTSLEVISPGLTPNAWRLSGKSLAVTNYFNHTAATFRGIRGQMISGYQYLGGHYQDKKGVGQATPRKLLSVYGDKTESLAAVLRDKGYATGFLSPHDKDEQLRFLMQASGFEKTYSSEDCGPNEELTDKMQYECLFKRAEQYSADRKPFFLSTYVVGTHHGMDSPDLKWKDGDNAYLNKFHNQDHWLGVFLEQFKQSPMSENTLLVFTTDHATYPTDQYNKTFGTKARYFVGKIPLLFYLKGNDPAVLDAGNRNSLCFAPTLLDLLGVTDVPNHFLGESLFSDGHSVFSRLSIFNDVLFETKSGEVNEISPQDLPPGLLDRILKFYDYAG